MLIIHGYICDTSLNWYHFYNLKKVKNTHGGGCFGVFDVFYIKASHMIYFRYALKSLDKKRIKLKQGESLALNERIMLSLVCVCIMILHVISHVISILSFHCTDVQQPFIALSM